MYGANTVMELVDSVVSKLDNDEPKSVIHYCRGLQCNFQKMAQLQKISIAYIGTRWIIIIDPCLLHRK